MEEEQEKFSLSVPLKMSKEKYYEIIFVPYS